MAVTYICIIFSDTKPDKILYVGRKVGTAFHFGVGSFYICQLKHLEDFYTRKLLVKTCFFFRPFFSSHLIRLTLRRYIVSPLKTSYAPHLLFKEYRFRNSALNLGHDL